MPVDPETFDFSVHPRVPGVVMLCRDLKRIVHEVRRFLVIHHLFSLL